MSRATVGIDLGGSKALCVLLRGGVIAEQVTYPTGRGTGPSEALTLIEGAVQRWRARGDVPSAIGVGFPGLVDHGAGVARSSVMLDGWREFDLAAAVRERTGLPCFVDNDVNVAALGEQLARGDEPDCDAMLFVAVGTGIGGAWTIDGQLWRGASGTAGEIGNIVVDPGGATCWCGRRGCLNTVASGSAIEAAAGLRSGCLAAAWEAPGPRLEAAVERAGRALGRALTEAIQLMNPALVAIGGGVAELGEALLAPCRRVVAEQAFPETAAAVRIERARGGYEAAAVGAAVLASDRTEEGG